MSRYPFFLTLLSLALIATFAGAQGVAQAQYITFDSAVPGAMAEGTVYGLVSPERSTLVEQVVAYNPPTGGNDGPEIAAPSLAGALQGGQVMACDPANSNDEGVWVELTQSYALDDVTVEAMFFTSEVNPDRPGSAANLGLQYIVSTEIPGAGAGFFQAQIRIFGQNGQIEWNAGQPGGLPEVKVTAAIASGTWYHVAGTLDYNDADPANSTMELFLAAGRVINLATDSQGTVTINLDHVDVTTGWAPPSTATIGPNSDQKPRYMVGCSPSNSINGIDRRGLLGEIDAIAVSGQIGEVFLPDAPPIPPVTASGSWTLYR